MVVVVGGGGGGVGVGRRVGVAGWGCWGWSKRSNPEHVECSFDFNPD